jgi:hypothetical protein
MNNAHPPIYVVGRARTPMAEYVGALKDTSPVDSAPSRHARRWNAPVFNPSGSATSCSAMSFRLSAAASTIREQVAEVDLRLRSSNAAFDAGVRLPNVNDVFKGRAPDLGAFEFDQPLSLDGPRDNSVPKSLCR